MLFNVRFKRLVREILVEPTIERYWDLLYEVEGYANERHKELIDMIEEIKAKADKKDILVAVYTVSKLVSDKIVEDLRDIINRL